MKVEKNLLDRAVTLSLSLGIAALAGTALVASASETVVRGSYKGVVPVARFDVSPNFRDIPPVPVYRGPLVPLREFEESESGLEFLKGNYLQPPDLHLQSIKGVRVIPAPSVSFDAQPNTAGVNPPDPAGDVGPNHYVALANSSLQIFTKAGVSLMGPVNINTLWAGFGGACQTENAGDPVVMHDQFADRWIITQFTAAGPTFFNCVAISQTADPTGAYFRYAFTTGTNFPDYPKYGVWSDSYLISTREFTGAGGPFAGIGAYAVNKAQMLVGDPNPTVIKFIAAPAGMPYNTGDGLLPADIDGATLPPAGTPAFYVGSMDAGGPYGAPQDALTLWKFVTDFTTPANSSFTLTNTIPVATFDSIYPCAPTARECLPQQGTAVKIDILSYRQRALNRLVYRNFGTHQALLTNQSVEAAPAIAGIRWWEIRSPNAAPVIFQEGTYAPGVTDGIHRWMASAAMDGSGNIGLGFSTTSATAFPSIGYTGRLATDPLGTMSLGEGVIVTGTGANTGGGSRWGDYTSMNIDPTDDCTFWYVNEYAPVTSATGWRLRVGAFRFNECGVPTFALSTASDSRTICARDSTTVPINLSSISNFNSPVTFSSSGVPAGASVSFSVNPVTSLPGTSVARIDTTPAIAAGTYAIALNGDSAGPITRTLALNLTVQTQPATAPVLAMPANNATAVVPSPTLSWAAAPQTSSYLVELATDAAFTTIVAQQVVNGTSFIVPNLLTSTRYFWRVSARNACAGAPLIEFFANGFEDSRGSSTRSAVFSFTTQAGPGDCSVGTASSVFSDDMENGAPNWTHAAATGTDTWALSTAFPASPVNAYRGVAPVTQADQRLISPSITIPGDSNQHLLRFNQRVAMEPTSSGTACFDGGILEVSTDAGATFTQVTAGITGLPYTGLVDTGNVAIGGRAAWCGDSTAHRVTAVDLAPYNGQTVQFRFRLGSDTGVNRLDGWNIDDFRVVNCTP
jgi:hypothetical protein